MKKIISILTLLFYANQINAQNDADAIRYSMLNYGSTARSLGMANSFGALGADASTFAINPAGIALYRKSEVTISPLFSNRSIDGSYLNNTKNDNYFKFAFGNLAIVWASNKEDKRNMKWSFGIAYNKTNDFSSNSVASGINLKNSLLQSFSEDLGTLDNSNGFPYYVANSNYNDPANISFDYPFDVDLAWQTFLIDSLNVGGTTYYFNSTPYAGVQQTRRVETRGGQGEWDFTLGTSINEKLYLGATIGATTINYREQITWKEEDIADTIPGFKSYEYTTTLRTEGGGFNIKVGGIYRPIDELRIGVSVHTPTWNSLTDNYSTSIVANLENQIGGIETLTYSSPDFIPYDYLIKTPFRAIGSLGFIAGKIGAVNLEYEYVNYGQAKLNSVDNQFDSDFDPANAAIKSKYTVSHNFKIGAEIRYDLYRFRVGASQSTTPFSAAYKGSTDTDLSRMSLTGGLGIKKKKYFIDVAYAHSAVGSFLRPYNMKNQNVNGITYNQNDNRVLFTFGWNF
jgi:hypothetical protein